MLIVVWPVLTTVNASALTKALNGRTARSAALCSSCFSCAVSCRATISGRFRFAGIYFYLAYPMHHHYYIGDEAASKHHSWLSWPHRRQSIYVLIDKY
jgi:hypothetical protein